MKIESDVAQYVMKCGPSIVGWYANMEALFFGE
jgi:hypothetical protein